MFPVILIDFFEFFTLFLPKDHLRKSLDNNYYNHYFTTCVCVWQMDCTDKGNAQLYRQQIQLLFLT